MELPSTSMSDRNPHRDALEAAHARIAELERVVAERRGEDARSHEMAALLRERAHVVEQTTPVNVWRMLRYGFVVCPLAALAFAVDRDWPIAVITLVVPFAMAVVGQRFARGNAEAALRQVALIDRRLAELEKGEKQP
jgi:hypothetical protein